MAIPSEGASAASAPPPFLLTIESAKFNFSVIKDEIKNKTHYLRREQSLIFKSITMGNVLIKGYLHQLQEAYQGGNWLDEDISKKLRLITEENAFEKPQSYIHSVAEVVSHIVEWRKELLERFRFGRYPKLTVDSPNNWIPNEKLKKNGWAHLKAELGDTQRHLITLLEAKDDSFLHLDWAGQENYGHLLVGLIEHDIYHLGQIGLIYKMVTYQSQIN